MGSANLQGQQDDNQEKIKSLKVAFFTEQLSLSPKEATVFWPLYNTYEKEKEAIMGQKRREVYDKIGGTSGATAGMTDAERIIYFDYDSSEIRPQYAETITALARRLAAGSGLRVRLEGHTDERGSREYNIALGERRAQAVRRALLLQGAGDAQVMTVSFGEERPAAEGADESAYQQNRRVEIVDAG